MVPDIKIYDPKWFGGVFLKSLLLIFLYEVFSALNHIFNSSFNTGQILSAIFFVIVFFVCIKSPKVGLYLALIELLIGSQGHGLDVFLGQQAISLRMILFLGTMLGCLVMRSKRDFLSFILSYLRKNNVLIVFGAIFVFGIFMAFVRANPLNYIINDANAWIYFFYIFPALYFSKNPNNLKNLWPIVIATTLSIAIKSLLYLYVFSHKFENLQVFLYDWGRDTRWGEFTLAGGGLYRIFSQAQIFSMIIASVIIGYLFFKGRHGYSHNSNKYLGLILSINIATIILSLSRSFWLGFLAAVVIAFAISLFIYRFKIINSLSLILRTLIYSGLSFFILIWVLFFPWPERTVFNPNQALNDRLEIQDQAGASRWNQVPHLLKAIARHPILGSGWGTAITYESRDPRIATPNNPKGIYTTYAFEWGYLDIILKIGLLGLGTYLVLIGQITNKFLKLINLNKKEHFRNALLWGFILGLIALLTTHMFSPYLNHPLGIGYLIIMLCVMEHFHYSSIEPIKS